jgi:hypothetical protein
MRRTTVLRGRLAIPAMASLALIGLLAVAGGVTPPAVQEARAAPATPNVLVITTDDQTLESMRVMDNVNSLIGDQGATFDNSFVNYSLCCPSRATFLTGQYSHNHRVLDNKEPAGGFTRFEALHGDNNLAIWLQNAGYYTAMIGKTLNGYPGDVVPDGWSEWYAGAPNDQSVYDYTMNENGTMVSYGHAVTDFKQDVLTDKAVDFVDRVAQGVELRLACVIALPNPRDRDQRRLADGVEASGADVVEVVPERVPEAARRGAGSELEVDQPDGWNARLRERDVIVDDPLGGPH